MNTNVLCAVFRRNFVSYFANPTGYLFIGAFVFLSTVAAFWPNEFFNANLANLDQLNLVFPFIMLVFIPAITMSIWADERRQGTDELLLTIPAADFDIVLGKYLAAVAIFTVSLGFSLVCNYLVLNRLASADAGFALAPSLDLGLFLGTYAGYWLIGLAMLAVGMIASFLTGNVTVAFVFGAIFNAPLVFAVFADAIFQPTLAAAVKHWSIGQQFRDFGRGVISLAGVAYFLAVLVVMLYLSMIFIGRRHWIRGRHWAALGGHYLVRTLALATVVIGLVFVLTNHDRRLDVTVERLSSLSPDTVKLVRQLDLKRPVEIEAFISPTVPETYVQTRLNLLAMLRELEALGGKNIQVRINDTERFSEDAARAEKLYSITPRQVTTLQRGVVSMDHIFMNVAVKSGVQKVPPVFVDRGIPVEYELVRSICTVAQQKRKRVGILTTDAQLYGSFNMQTMASGSNWPIVDELQKQYEVRQVDPAQPITEKFDVLLAVQPSSLGPEEMEHFLAAVRTGQPTAVFEDPCPIFSPNVPATSSPRQPPGGMNMQMMMMMGRQQAPPKGDIGKLWRTLGVGFGDDKIVWQDYNPYPKASHFPPEFVFVDTGEGVREPYNTDDSASSGLQHMLFPFPGWVNKLNASDMEFIPLVRTGEKTGTVNFSDIMRTGMMGQRGGLNPMRRQIPSSTQYILAAHIRGKVKPDAEMAGEADAKAEGGRGKAEGEAAKGEVKPDVKPEAKPEAKAADEHQPDAPAMDEKKPDVKAESKPVAALPGEKAKSKPGEVNVILVADIDMLSQDFFRLREQGDVPEAGLNFDFDNVTFVLNVLDELSGDQRFVEIRKRRPKHRTLARIEELTGEARRNATKSREEFTKKADEEEQKAQKELEDKIEAMKNRKDASSQDMLNEVAMAYQDGQRRLEIKREQLHAERDRKINAIETDLVLKVNAVRHQYKMWAVLLPPIPPLLVGIAVFFRRRSREREGVSRSRLR